ncbi:integral membrane protein [Seiridium cupressi]
MTGVMENRGPQLRVIDYVFVIIAFITILMRCGVRLFITKSFGIDDWLMTLAATTFILYCSFSITGVHYGTGRHEYDLPAADVATARMYWWSCYLMYCMTMILSKLSIGYLLLRVAVQRLHTWIIYGAMVITGITCTVFFFVTVLQCQPVSFFWNKHQSGTCVNMDVIIALAYLYSTCAVITDFTFALIPAWIISGLQLHRRTKIALIPLMAMGCVASAAVVVRFAYLPRFRDPDFLWATLDIAIWSSVEQGLAVAAGSLATLRPLLKLVGWKLGLTTGPSHFGPSSYGKMGSRGGHLSGRRNTADVLTMNSLRADPNAPEQSSKFPTSYQIRCEGKSPKSQADLGSVSNTISHSLTYEVSSEYVSQPPNAEKKKSWRVSGHGNSQEASRSERSKHFRSESMDRLRPEPLNEDRFGPATSPV